ncbi:protein of unknown function (plasmid) [Azospirillum lipoferum 4B]|uniref:Uncharacterized protein n=1 Tax=Azospirillum lipoferum (strain 4B) TaxID=862719 RepID=G7ZHK9_AZOL4|nr:protein of unknown function [Azospirillum lipoferum 4B]
MFMPMREQPPSGRNRISSLPGTGPVGPPPWTGMVAGREPSKSSRGRGLRLRARLFGAIRRRFESNVMPLSYVSLRPAFDAAGQACIARRCGSREWGETLPEAPVRRPSDGWDRMFGMGLCGQRETHVKGAREKSHEMVGHCWDAWGGQLALSTAPRR